MPSERVSLLFHPEPRVRATYRAHLTLFILMAPFNAMIQYSPFLAIHTFKAPGWAPWLTAIIPAAHLLGIFFTHQINRGEKTRWVVHPLIISNLIFALLLFASPKHGWIFGVIMIFAMLLRAPIIAAQSAIFRTNYPPTLRSWAMSIPLALQTAFLALYSYGAGRLFDRDEWWVIPSFLVAGVVGIAGAASFRKVESDPTPPGEIDPLARGYLRGLIGQFSVLKTNPAFFRYQLAYMFTGGAMVAIAAVVPFYLKAEFGVAHGQATMAINTVPSLALAITMPFWGRLLDRHNPLLLRAVTSGLWLATPLMLWGAMTIHHVYAAQVIQGIVMSGGTLIWWVGVNYFAKAGEVAGLMSLHQTLTGVRGITMPFFGIWVGNHAGYRNSMLMWFGIALIGFWMMIVEVLRERREGGRLRSFSEAEADLDREEIPNTGTMADRRV